jgi:hypothetical protein
MNSKGMMGLVYSLLGAGLLAATTGCSETAMHARSVSPTVAFGATTSDVPAGCSPEGMPRVLATRVVPRVGVTATSDGSHVWLRFATTRAPRVVTQIDVESLEGAASGNAPPPETLDAASPADLRLADGRRLAAWTDGSLEQGMRVKTAAIGLDGAMVGDAVDLGYEGSAIGRPAVAVTSSGHGVLAFIESNGAGFQVVAVRVSCAAE